MCYELVPGALRAQLANTIQLSGDTTPRSNACWSAAVQASCEDFRPRTYLSKVRFLLMEDWSRVSWKRSDSNLELVAVSLAPDEDQQALESAVL